MVIIIIIVEHDDDDDGEHDDDDGPAYSHQSEFHQVGVSRHDGWVGI